MAKSKKDKDQQRAFKGIWITAEVWLSAELTMQEKLFLVEIESLDNEDGCYATNQYFSDFFGISKVRVSEVISSLIFKGFLVSNIDKSEGNERTIRVVKTRMQALKDSFNTLANKSLRGSQTKLKEGIKETFISKSNPVSNLFSSLVKESKSVVTDTPPLSQINLSEIPTGSESENDFYENLTTELKNEAASLKKEVESLKEKTLQKKPNSGGGGENVSNSVGEVGKPAKPKKAAREWFKLSSLTDEQKGKIRELARSFDSPGDFGDSLKQWLEYKESGQVNFKYQKINPYKDFETMLKQVSIEAKKCQGQSQAFKLAVEYSIENLYLGLFPDKFITQITPKNGTNNNKNQPNSKRQYATGI